MCLGVLENYLPMYNTATFLAWAYVGEGSEANRWAYQLIPLFLRHQIAALPFPSSAESGLRFLRSGTRSVAAGPQSKPNLRQSTMV